MAVAPGGAHAQIYLAAIPVLSGLLIGFRAGLFSTVLILATLTVLSLGIISAWSGLTTGILVFGLMLAVSLFQHEIEQANASLISMNNMSRSASERAQEMNRLLEVTLDSIDHGVAAYDAKLQLVAWNVNYEKLFDFPVGWLRKGRTLEEYFRLNASRGEYGEEAMQDINEAVGIRMNQLDVDVDEVKPHRYIRKRPNGRFLEIIGNPTPDGGLVVTFADITDREESRQEVERLAWTDPLTELFNRNSLRSTIVKSMNIASGAGKKIALLMVDLDKFKPVNDTYGHAAGDEVLRVIARRLKENIRSSDFAFRLGGDEFAVLVFLKKETTEINGFMPRFLETLRAPIDFEGRELCVGASIGVSFYPDSDENPDELIRKADIALYEAKENGRNCFRVYDQEVDEKAQKQQLFEAGIRDALNRKEFELYYQPKYSVRDDKIIGAEALIRWNHPSLGIVSPAEFIPIAERSDLVFPVGAWVMRSAWRQAHLWVEQFGSADFCLSVNVSARQFFDESFLRLLRELAASRPELASHIDLEITEEVTVGNVTEAATRMREIRDIGFNISIDDFGTGYSSISYLHQLPVRKIKIDKSFLDDFDTGKQARAVIKSMIRLGHNLGVKVVAEGVETAEQAAFLRENECDEIQGYYIGKPMKATLFANMLARENVEKRKLA